MLRKALKNDEDAIVRVYDEILKFQSQNINYTNWQKGLYPTRETAIEALNAGTIYVGEEMGEITGCVILNNSQPKEYSVIPWSISAKENEILVIHTLCILPSKAGRGLGKKYVNDIEKIAKDFDYKTIRLDTYEKNEPAIALYKKQGYSFAGKTDFNFQNCILETLVCFEKKVVK